MESLAIDVVDSILKGFSENKMVKCPVCRNTIDCTKQDSETKSNFYYCSKCGFTLSRKMDGYQIFYI